MSWFMQIGQISTVIDGMKPNLFQQANRKYTADNIDFSIKTGQMIPNAFQLTGTPGLVAGKIALGKKLDVFRGNELPVVLQQTSKLFSRATLTGGTKVDSDIDEYLHDIIRAFNLKLTNVTYIVQACLAGI